MDAKKKMKELKEGLTDKNTWIAVGMFFGAVAIFMLGKIVIDTIFFPGAYVTAIFLALILFIAGLIISTIKAMLDDRDRFK